MITLDASAAPIRLGVRRVAGPVAPLIGRAEFKAHAGIEFADLDGPIGEYLETAREVIEGRTNRITVNSTFDIVFDRAPGGRWLVLPLAPLVSVTSITAALEDGTTTTMSAADYVADTASEPGRVLLTSSASWPSSLRPIAALTVRAVFGYGTDGRNTPQIMRQAVRMLAAHYLEHRGATVDEGDGGAVVAIPEGIDALIASVRLIRL